MTAANVDPEVAYDQMLGAFKVAWDAGTPALNGGTVVPVEWPDILVGAPHLNSGEVPWARVSVKHSTGSQHSMGTVGKRIFTHSGTITVQIFTPAGKRGSVDGLRLGKVALNAFQGQRTEDVIFRRATLREVGSDGTWYQTNVTANFTYEQLT